MFDWMSGIGNALSGASNPAVPGLGQLYEPTLMEQAGQWMRQNPNQVWMGLDKVGQAFDPNNPFAGIGTEVAQSNLMQQKMAFDQQQQDKKMSGWQKQISSLMGGQGGLTPDGQAGVTKVNSTISPEGKRRVTFDMNDNTLGEVAPQAAPAPAQQFPDMPAAFNQSRQTPIGTRYTGAVDAILPESARTVYGRQGQQPPDMTPGQSTPDPGYVPAMADYSLGRTLAGEDLNIPGGAVNPWSLRR